MNYDHKILAETISKLDEIPTADEDYAEWIEAKAHLAFLRGNALADELVIYASGKYSFIHAVAVSNERLDPLDKEDLSRWSLNPYTSRLRSQ